MTPAAIDAHHGRRVRLARSVPTPHGPAGRRPGKDARRRAWRAERQAARAAIRAAMLAGGDA